MLSMVVPFCPGGSRRPGTCSSEDRTGPARSVVVWRLMSDASGRTYLRRKREAGALEPRELRVVVHEHAVGETGDLLQRSKGHAGPDMGAGWSRDGEVLHHAGGVTGDAEQPLRRADQDRLVTGCVARR